MLTIAEINQIKDPLELGTALIAYADAYAKKARETSNYETAKPFFKEAELAYNCAYEVLIEDLEHNVQD